MMLLFHLVSATPSGTDDRGGGIGDGRAAPARRPAPVRAPHARSAPHALTLARSLARPAGLYAPSCTAPSVSPSLFLPLSSPAHRSTLFSAPAPALSTRARFRGAPALARSSLAVPPRPDSPGCSHSLESRAVGSCTCRCIGPLSPPPSAPCSVPPAAGLRCSCAPRARGRCGPRCPHKRTHRRRPSRSGRHDRWRPYRRTDGAVARCLAPAPAAGPASAALPRPSSARPASSGATSSMGPWRPTGARSLGPRPWRLMRRAVGRSSSPVLCVPAAPPPQYVQIGPQRHAGDAAVPRRRTGRDAPKGDGRPRPAVATGTPRAARCRAAR